MERALHGGEDYELLFTMPEGKTAPGGVTKIGRIVRGKPGAIQFEGRALAVRGYDHFSVQR
jgi:thiamine-monophosphate kinase